MKVLLLHDYGTPTGGAEHQVLALRDGLRAAGHEVRLLASAASLVPGPQEADRTCFGTTVGRVQILSQTANPSAHRQLRRELDGFSPDVVHVRMFLSQLSPLILPLLRDVPAVYHAVRYEAVCPVGTKVLPDGSPCTEPAGRACLAHRCTTPQSWVLHMAQLAMVRRWRGVFDVVTALSRATAARLEADGFTDVEVVPNGIDVGAPRPDLSGPPLIAFAGRLVPEKGLSVLLAALVDVVRRVPGTRAVIAGHGPEADTVGRLVDELGLGAVVDLVGHLPHPALDERLAPAWVQVVPGLWEEPFGNVVTEAMARSTAVVASNVGGPADTVEHGTTGLLVAPGDTGALADALVSVLSCRARAHRMGQAGRARALESYTRASVVARFEAVYRRAVDHHRQRHSERSA